MEQSSTKHLTMANNIEAFTKKNQKENLNDAKMHNFTECCRMWMCSHCSKSFASSRALKIHEVKQHENATRHVLKCGTCHEEFEHANLLHIHMRVHHNVKVRCPRCKDIFEHPNVLKLHIKAHHSEPVCVACGLKFDHDKLLRLHMEHYHKVGSKGTKQGATTPRHKTGGRVKTGNVEIELNISGEEAERTDTDNHVDIRQVQEGHVHTNGLVPNEWELGCRSHEYDDEAMSHGSSDSREDCGSTEDEVGDMETDKGSDRELTETDSHVTRQDSELEHHQYSPPQPNNEIERSVSPKSENGSDPVAVEEMDSGIPAPAVEYHKAPTQLQRSSVIVTTSSVSPPMTIPRVSLKHNIDDSGDAPQESATSCVFLPAHLPNLDGNLEGSPQSPAGSYSSTLSGDDESGDSGSPNHKARTTKRATALRCNRCQEEFLSKMEYLHHLISHQNDDKTIELTPENQAIEKLKSSLLIKMEARRRDSIADEVNQGFTSAAQTDAALPNDQTFSEAIRTSPPHKEDQMRDLTVPCKLCNERFPDSRELRAHVENCHKMPHCTECGLHFEHKNLLKIHMNSYHSSLDVLQCYYCGKSFDNRAEFVSHVTSHETTLVNSKETRRKPNSLRRVLSATTAEAETPNQSRSEKPCFPESDSVGNNDVLEDNCQAKKQGDIRTVVYPDPVKNLRLCVERHFPMFSAFRHHKKETSSSQEPDDWYDKEKSNYLVGPEAKTRIFLPKRHETIEREGNFNDQRRVPDELETFSPTTEVKSDSVERMPSSGAFKRRFSAFSAYERTDRSNDLAKNMLLGLSRGKRDGPPLGGPPPLIPVVHPRLCRTFAQQSGVDLRRVHQPVTRTSSANSALLYHKAPPLPTLTPKWKEPLQRVVPPSPVQDSSQDHREVTVRESINNITKEALLHSLSLKRRASAPELGALVRPHEAQRLMSGTTTIKNLLEKSPQRSDNIEHPGTSPGRSRQLNEAYQPRRRHPRDFTCHHCGIYFGHKKLLKIHLDCYHGSTQELQCLRCEKNFSSRSDFLEHLMSHEGGDELLAIQRKRLKLTARNSVPLTHQGETVIRRELNINATGQDAAVTRETTPRDDLHITGIRGEFRHPLPEELKQRVDEEHREHPAQQDKSNNALKRKHPITSVKPSSVKNEDEDGANFCFVCGQSFSNGKKLEHHISSHAVVDKDGRYCCSLCHKTFDHHRKLEIHTRSHTGFKPHKCELCGRCFPYYSSYYYHKMTHTEDRPHKCGVCGKGFIQTRYLRSHMKTHKDQNGWTSDDELNDESPEQMETSEDAAITRSPYSETETKIKTEPVDQSECSPQRDLEEHNTARILCSFKQGSGVGLCEQTSPKPVETDTETHSHVASKEPSGSEDSPSIDRTREPNSPPSMNRTPERNSSRQPTEDGQVESTNHSNDTETVTKIKKETPQDSTDELLPKTKKKKYQCKHCQKNFSSYSSLHVHVRIHTGQRPYSCSHCFKKFTHSSGLKRHVRCHTGEKPYPCPACPAAFADRGALKSHIRTHTGERPFVCDLCNKTFTQPSSLRVHKKTVHAHEFFDDK